MDMTGLLKSYHNLDTYKTPCEHVQQLAYGWHISMNTELFEGTLRESV